MFARATTTVTIWTGTTTDEWGDPVDNTTVKASGVPAMIIEQKVKAFSENSTVPRVIRYITGRVSSGVDVSDNDRLRDERSGDVYIITNVSDVDNPVRMQDIRMDLQRVGD